MNNFNYSLEIEIAFVIPPGPLRSIKKPSQSDLVSRDGKKASWIAKGTHAT